MQGREAMQLASEGELKKWHGYLVVAIVSIVLYLNSLPGEFVFDDHEAIETNKDVRSEVCGQHSLCRLVWYPLHFITGVTRPSPMSSAMTSGVFRSLMLSHTSLTVP